MDSFVNKDINQYGNGTEQEDILKLIALAIPSTEQQRRQQGDDDDQDMNDRDYNGQQVITQRDFHDTMSAIIKRDYFPELQQKSNLPGYLYQQSDDSHSDGMTLDTFLAKHIGEEDAEFGRLLARQNQDKVSMLEKRLQAQNIDTSRLRIDYKPQKLLMGVPSANDLNLLNAPPETPDLIQTQNTRLSQTASTVNQNLMPDVSVVHPLPPDNYQFVKDTPDLSSMQQPEFTWGNVAATPVIIREDDAESLVQQSVSEPFKMLHLQRKDILSKSLSDRASRSIRDRAGIIAAHPGASGGESGRFSRLPPAFNQRNTSSLLYRQRDNASGTASRRFQGSSSSGRNLGIRDNDSTMVASTARSSSLHSSVSGFRSRERRLAALSPAAHQLLMRHGQQKSQSSQLPYRRSSSSSAQTPTLTPFTPTVQQHQQEE
ncbi:hypothetical protein MIR68_009849 [Amoeboaphelidium protococcarum]|nr:hypothetical protein MIR68_009849 [Amoeboaphelidium protococcarum]